MQIALFLNGFNTIIGLRNSKGEIIVKTFESTLLFKDPRLFKDRFISIVAHNLGVNDFSNVSRLIFSVNGDVNYEIGRIQSSDFINDVLHSKTFDGFSFKNELGSLIGKENIFVINDVQTISLGISKLYPEIPRPFIVVYGAWGMGISYVNIGEQILSFDLGMEIVQDTNKLTVHRTIGKEGVERLLRDGSKNIYSDFTSNFILGCNYFLPKVREVISLGKSSKSISTVAYRSEVKSIFIWTAAEEYLQKEKLSAIDNCVIVFPKDKIEKELIPILGCFEYPDYKSKLNELVKRIEYYSGLEKIYTFENYEKFYEHWASVHTFANSDNEYRVFYQNDSVKILKMRELGREEQLLEYKF